MCPSNGVGGRGQRVPYVVGGLHPFPPPGVLGGEEGEGRDVSATCDRQSGGPSGPGPQPLRALAAWPWAAAPSGPWSSPSTPSAQRPTPGRGGGGSGWGATGERSGEVIKDFQREGRDGGVEGGG